MGACYEHERRWWWTARLVLLVAVWLVGMRSFGFDYVEFDDPRMVYLNPHIQHLSLTNLHWMFTDFSYNNRFYSPLLWLLYAVSGAAVGFAPQPQHVVSVVLHLASAWIVFEILRVLCERMHCTGESISAERAILPPLIGAMFWALHPLRVEADGWIAARVHLHAALFALGATLAYCVARRDAGQSLIVKRALFWLAVILYACSILSFPMAIMLPVALGVLDWYVFDAHRACKPFMRALRIARDLAPFLIVAAIPAAIGMIGYASATRTDTPVLPPLGIAGRFAADCYVLWHYLAATAEPVGLSPIYTQMLNLHQHLRLFVFSIASVIGISVAAFTLRRRWPGLWCAWLCYIIMLIPFIGLPAMPMFASDRYCYVACVAWSALLAWLVQKLWELKLPALRVAASAVMACVLIVLASLSTLQMGIWRDTVTFYQAVLNRLGHDPYRADFMWRMAVHYYNQDDPETAMIWIDRAIAVQPDPLLESWRSMILAKFCKQAEQSGATRDVLASRYADFLAYYLQTPSLAANADASRLVVPVYNRLRRLTAEADLQAAATQPDARNAIRVQALTAARIAADAEKQSDTHQVMALYEQAYADLQRAFAISPDSQIDETYGVICAKLQKWEESAFALEAAMRAAPDSPVIPLRLAQVYYALRRKPDADALLDKTVQRWPETRAQVKMIRQRWEFTAADRP